MSNIPLNIDLQQIMLHLFNFTILFGALYILLYKPVRDFMESRDVHYAEINTKAETDLAAAEASKREYDDKLRAFDLEMKEERTKASQEIEAQRNQQIAEAKAEASRIIADAKAEADRHKEEIVASAQKDITDMVTDAMEKFAMSPSDAFDEFLDAAEGKND